MDRKGNEFGTEKFVLIPQIQEEIRIIPEGTQLSDYLYDEYWENPTYNAECKIIWDKLIELRPIVEQLKPEEKKGQYNYSNMEWVMKTACRMADPS